MLIIVLTKITIMRTKPPGSYTINKVINNYMDKNMVNKSKLIDHLLDEFFQSRKAIPKKFKK